MTFRKASEVIQEHDSNVRLEKERIKLLIFDSSLNLNVLCDFIDLLAYELRFKKKYKVKINEKHNRGAAYKKVKKESEDDCSVEEDCTDSF